MHDARAVAVALGSAVRSGAGWLARCPVLTHGRGRGDVHPSLSLLQGEAGRLLVRCHGGCDQERVIAALRWRGLWEENGHRRLTRPAPRVAAIYRPDREDAKHTEAALAIWKSAKPADGTLAKTYLVSRGLHIPPPPTLRFHPGLQHPSGGIWPAMVALAWISHWAGASAPGIWDHPFRTKG